MGKLPLTWLGLGHLSGLSIISCQTYESDGRKQINVRYRIARMCFSEPLEPFWAGSFSWNDVPNYSSPKYKDFDEQEVEIIVTTEFRYHIDAEQEKLMADTIFNLWSIKSGHANWQRELRMAEFEREAAYRRL